MLLRICLCLSFIILFLVVIDSVVWIFLIGLISFLFNSLVLGRLVFFLLVCNGKKWNSVFCVVCLEINVLIFWWWVIILVFVSNVSVLWMVFWLILNLLVSLNLLGSILFGC